MTPITLAGKNENVPGFFVYKILTPVLQTLPSERANSQGVGMANGCLGLVLWGQLLLLVVVDFGLSSFVPYFTQLEN